MSVTKISALGWENVAQLLNGQTELLVTLDVGPRILSYKLAGEENILRIFQDQLGNKGEDEYKVRGGHRMWVAPENERTYAPDNSPVKYEVRETNMLIATTPAEEKWMVSKEMSISLAADSSSVTIRHRATNEGPEPATIASWGLTVMAPGGWQIIPQPPLGEHGKEFLPNRVIVPWSYTDLSDDRWKIGRRFWTLTPKAGRPATKLGFAHREHWVAYILGKQLFLKSFDYEAGAEYPDLGCNYETFSKSDFLEMETLSPIRTLGPGQSVHHTETWHLFGDITAPNAVDEAALERWLQPFLRKIGFL